MTESDGAAFLVALQCWQEDDEHDESLLEYIDHSLREYAEVNAYEEEDLESFLLYIRAKKFAMNHFFKDMKLREES